MTRDENGNENKARSELSAGLCMDEKRKVAAMKLLEAAQEFWDACHEEGQYGAVQWIEDCDGRLLIYTRGEYRQQLMNNIHSLPSAKVHFFNGEVIPNEDA